MDEIHAIIIGMMHASSDKRHADRLVRNPFARRSGPIIRINVTLQLEYSRSTEARKPRFKPVPCGQHACHAHQSTLANIRDFLSFYRWDLPAHDVPGVTWLELLIAYELQPMQA